MTSTIEQNPPAWADRRSDGECADSKNPVSRHGASLTPVAGNPFDAIEITAFEHVAHPYIRATISARSGAIVIHGIHLLHDGPNRLFVRLPQVSVTLGDGRLSASTRPSVTFATAELAESWRAALIERLWQQYPKQMARAGEPLKESQ